MEKELSLTIIHNDQGEEGFCSRKTTCGSCLKISAGRRN